VIVTVHSHLPTASFAGHAWRGDSGGDCLLLSADMLPYKKTLSEKEMWQIVVFIRSIGPQKKK
jgi:hypothetical protein